MKIPIKIHPAFWIMALLISWDFAGNIQLALVYTGVIFVSLLAHELGHAVVAKTFGQQVAIEFQLLWGQTHHRGGQLRPWQQFLVTACGPIANLGIIIIMSFLAPLVPSGAVLVNAAISFAYYTNILWLAINLLPILPLDGGKLLSILLEKVMGLSGLKIARFLGMALGLLLGVYLFVHSNWLAGAVFLMFAYENYRAYQQALSMVDSDRNLSNRELLEKGLDLMHQQCFTQAGEIFAEVRGLTKKGALYSKATENYATIMHCHGDDSQAYKMLKEIDKALSPAGKHLLQQLAYNHEDYMEAIKVGDDFFRSYANGQTAFRNAQAHAQLGNNDKALYWLKSAQRYGLPDFKNKIQTPEFDKLNLQHLG
ncbi:MAG: site-2 protease family protein [Chlamydiota bacterium]